MGIKFLSLQMVPWCFHLMGSHICCVQFQPEPPIVGRTIKLIKSDGLVKIYHRPIHVSQLMVEFPKHMVCRSDSFYIGQKIPALSEDDKLQLGHDYFLLPKHFFQTVLSFVTIASLASSSSSQQRQLLQPPAAAAAASSICSTRSYSDSKIAFLKKAASCQPFDIQKTPSGCLRIRVSEKFISQLLMEEGNKVKQEEEEGSSAGKTSSSTESRVCTTPQLRKDYTQLVGSRRHNWKPKLETIRETHEKRRLKLSSFGTKKLMKRSQSLGIAQNTHHHHRSELHHHHFHHHPVSSSLSTVNSPPKLMSEVL